MHDLGLVLITAGVVSIVSYAAGVKEGMARAARRWSNRRAA